MEIITKPKVNIVFSASSLDLFQLCNARFNYGHNLRKTLPPITDKASSLDKGTLIHAGLESYYNNLAAGMNYSDRVSEAQMKIRQVSSDPRNSSVMGDDLQFILDTVEENLDYWRSEDEQLEILAVEQPFDYILFEDEDIRIILNGKIDLLVNMKLVGGRSEYNNLPFDHKSFSRSGPTFRLANQFMNYCSVTNSNYLIVNKVGLQKSLKAEEKFKRVPLSYDPLIIQEWKENVIDVVMNQYLNCVATNKWPTNFTSCLKYNKMCEFSDICDSSGADVKLFKLESNYVVNDKYDKYNREEE